METPPNKNFLLFIAPIIGVILGIAILLSPGFASLFSENKPEEGVSKYAYYEQVITQDELIKLSTEKEIFTVYYNQPIDGISGSVWNTQAEANTAEETYKKDHGNDLTLPDTQAPGGYQPGVGETTSISQ